MITPLLRPALVDREDVVELLEQMIHGSGEVRILLISALGGIGKTKLMGILQDRCGQRIPCARVDFYNTPIGLIDVMDRMRNGLKGTGFKNFENAVEQLPKPGQVSVGGNFMVGLRGMTTINVESNTSAYEDERQQLMLTNAFCEDLRSAGRILLLFDTFEQCGSTVRDWMQGPFLSRLCHVENVIVVIAGRALPPPGEWTEFSHTIPLEGLKPLHWHQFAESVGLAVTLSEMEWFCEGRSNSQELASLILARANRERMHGK